MTFDHIHKRNDQITLLLVDDDYQYLESIEHAFRHSGYRVFTSSDAAGCMRIAKEIHPDIILLDVDLPDQDGFDVAKALHDDPALEGVFIIFLSGKFTQSENQTEGILLGARGYITKPITPRELLARISAYAHLKTAEDALRRSEQQSRMIIDQNADCMLLIDQRGKIILCNPSAETLFGRPEQELIGVDFGFPLDEHQRVEIRIQQNETVCRDAEMRVNQTVWNGQSVFLATIRDMTERKQKELELREACFKAEEAQRVKSEFIAHVSHEIRSPLNIIVGYARLLAQEMPSQIRESERYIIDSILRGSERLMRTIESILNLSRMEAGDINANGQTIDMQHLLSTLVTDYQAIARKKGLTLHVENTVRPVSIFADTFALTQAITNLIDNAIKYTERGGITLRLYQGKEAHVMLDVSDTGIGISEEYLPNLFQPFSQENGGTHRSYHGIGLGMSLVKKYLALLHAEIDVRSVLSVGTTFTITFSKLNTKLQPAYTTPRRKENDTMFPQENHTQTTPTHTILVVEDDDLTLEYMEIVLTRNFYQVRTARTALEIWTQIEEHHVDLILMDISLVGEVDGLELTKQIRSVERFRMIPIIAVTAHAHHLDRLNSLAAGCNEHIPKPIHVDRLLQIISQHLLSF